MSISTVFFSFGKDKEASEESDSDDSEGTSSDESVEDLDDVDIDNEVGDVNVDYSLQNKGMTKMAFM